MESESDSSILEKCKRLLESLKNSNRTLPATEETIDDLFKCALEVEEIFLQEEKTRINELLRKNYPNMNFNKPVDFLIECIIKNQHLDENLTVYAINKYIVLYSENAYSELLNKLLSEVELRTHLFNLAEENPDLELDLNRLNHFLGDLMNSSDVKFKVQNALKSETSDFLKSVQHGEFLTAQILVDEMISCLESQIDLRLWFLLMREENTEAVLDLCVTYSSFLNAVLKFFDKFADEVESNYDEELNVQYSHVNLDFEDFVKIVKIFINKEDTKKVISEFLESKNLKSKNFLFWVDVKACL